MREIVTELREQGPTEAEVERARAYAAGARAIAFENTGAVARHAAQQTIVYGEAVDPDEAIALLDAVTEDEVAEVAAGIADELSVACVGPHTVGGVRVRVDRCVARRGRGGDRPGRRCGGQGPAATPPSPTASALDGHDRSPAPHAAPRPATALADGARAPAPARSSASSGSPAARRGAYVYDITTGEPLFALARPVKRPPASVEKLFTTVALLNELGAERPPAHGRARDRPPRRRRRLARQPVPARRRRSRRSATAPSTGSGSGATARPRRSSRVQLDRDGIRRVTGQLIGDASLFDARRGPPSSGFAPDIPDLGGQLSALTYDHGATLAAAVTRNTARSRRRHRTPPPLTPGAFAARELALTLQRCTSRVTASTRTRTTPARAHRLAIVSSPPMSVMLRLMDVPSDDFFAEMLTKQLGARSSARHDAAGAYAIASAIASATTCTRRSSTARACRATTSPRRSRSSTCSRDIDGTATGAMLAASLPTVGVSGTIADDRGATAAAGRCIAKTGTLNNVTNLAGYCHARGRQLLAFALFIDGPPNWTALTLIGRMVAAIATY